MDSRGHNALPRIQRVSGNAQGTSGMYHQNHTRARVNTTSSTPNETMRTAVWTAVALQQQLASSVAAVVVASPALRPIALPSTHLPAPSSRPRETLAQKMGLAPAAPPPPTEDEWENAERRALDRLQGGEGKKKLIPLSTSRMNPSLPYSGGSNRIEEYGSCCICQEKFTMTMSQGQVLLDCSHVFHEVCLRQFERYARQMSREAASLTRGNAYLQANVVLRSCPLCRKEMYHKRVFYVGKALAQQAMVVKVQSCVRRWLANQRVRKLKLHANVDYRHKYLYDKIKSLTDAWSVFADHHVRRVDVYLSRVDVQQQYIAGAMMDAAEWDALRCEFERRQRESATGQFEMMCPICLTQVLLEGARWDDAEAKDQGEPKPMRGSSLSVAAPKAIASPRGNSTAKSQRRFRSGPQRQRAKSKNPKPVPNPSPQHPTHSSEHRFGTDLDSVDGKDVNHSPPPPPPSASTTMALLSCSHCFHSTCLQTFERFMQFQGASSPPPAGHAQAGQPTEACPRCPVCRSGYAKRLLRI